jgi:hypothetical protein
MTKAYALLAAGVLLLGATVCPAGDRGVIPVQVIPTEVRTAPGTQIQVVNGEWINPPRSGVQVIPVETMSAPQTEVEVVPAEAISAPGTPMQVAPHEVTCETGNCNCEGADHVSHWEALHDWLTYHHRPCDACTCHRCYPCCTPNLYLYFLCPGQCGYGSQGCASCAGNVAAVGSSHPVHSSVTSPETITKVAESPMAIDSPYQVDSSAVTPATSGKALYIASQQQMNAVLSSGLPPGTVIMTVGPDGRPVKESALVVGR